MDGYLKDNGSNNIGKKAESRLSFVRWAYLEGAKIVLFVVFRFQDYIANFG